ncbi:MAG: SEC-C domain-containing protein [Nocardioidaceae bacterium]|nr:MAG: SEC-C domain-containing protein [Nocardioidaceae bacterium]
MGKKSRVRARNEVAPAARTGEYAGVGPRQPCPCGSGRRFKACHGSADGPAPVFVNRPFEGLPGECDLIAMRELVPAATAPVKLRDSDREVVLCSLLPMAAPALVRDSGAIWLGLQVQHGYGDPSRDLAAVLEQALDAEPGDVIGLKSDPGPGSRLQDLLATEPFEVTVHEGFEFWFTDTEVDSATTAALEQANAAITPTIKLTSVPSAYWVDAGSKEHLRVVLPQAEDALLDALARLHAAGKDRLVEGSRFVGMFRAHGTLTPVWDLPVGTGAEALEEPAAAFLADLEDALARPESLTESERAARSGLANRQVTIR